MDCEFETNVAGDHQPHHTHTTRPSGGLFTIVLFPLVLVGATQRRT
jgi:hypothetical protein